MHGWKIPIKNMKTCQMQKSEQLSEKWTTEQKVRQSVTNVCQLVLFTSTINHTWATSIAVPPEHENPAHP